MLTGRDLGLKRGTAPLFSGINIALQPGSVLLLRGANGSGKTSLLRILAGLAGGFDGEVRWTDRSAPSTGSDSPSALAHLTLFLGHVAPLKDELTALENLAFSMRFEGLRLPERELLTALQDVGLASRAGLRARQLSRGQRQRIGLARMALTRRPLWLLDEPLTALDADGAELLLARLDSHLGRGGMAVVATHHDLALSAPTQTLALA